MNIRSVLPTLLIFLPKIRQIKKMKTLYFLFLTIAFVGMQQRTLLAYPGDRILDKPNSPLSFVAKESEDEEFVAESVQMRFLK